MLNLLKQGHPKGLYLLFFVEMWERFSYYGMRALLVLYMINELMYSVQRAGNIYGAYTGLVYLTPLLGGYLADRYFGQRKCITAGAILMIIGLGLLSSGYHACFLPALFFMIMANGFFKSNISSVVGFLYKDNNEKKDSAFTIFYMGINLGAFFSPLICGTLAIKYGFNMGFMSAGIGMCLGLILYKLFENKYLGEAGLYPFKNMKKHQEGTSTVLTAEDKSNLRVLFLLLLFTIIFWVCYEQAGSSLTLFAEYSTNRRIFNFEIPTGYFQSLNPLYIMILAPIMSSLWSFLGQKNREPSSATKFAIALFLMSFSYFIMAIAGHFAEKSTVSVLWLVTVYFVMTIAELCLSPIGLSLVTKLAPKQMLSMIMGIWFLTSCIGNLLAGLWAGLYGTISASNLFLVLCGISLLGGILLACCLPKFNKLLSKKS